MKRCIALVALLLAVSTLFSSCCCFPLSSMYYNAEEFVESLLPQSVVGTWETTADGTTMTLCFNEDGTGTVDVSGFTVDMTWEVIGDGLYADITVMGVEETLFDGVKYAISGNVLSITDNGETIDFYKQ